MELRCTAERSGRLLSFLRGELGLSATLVKRLKSENAFFVSGSPAHTDRCVTVGEEIAVRFHESPPDYPAEEGPLDVLYEDETLLAADKPAGLWIHPTPSRLCGTLANRAAYHLRGQGCGVHVVTRLDRDTFGVVLIAKFSHFHAFFSAALAKGQVEKTYLAAVAGAPPEERGTVALPIARREGRSLLREARSDGKPAVTEYCVLTCDSRHSLLELRPKTGRTHQLRVHCAALGCPILGDRDYGGGTGALQLCASSLRFPHPLTGEQIRIDSRQRPIFANLPVEPGAVSVYNTS